MQWTNEQKRAIEARDTNILLSAAAGSGKTTVLVGRILALIESGETSIDRMLIVTFTRAASADMRAKLARELGKRAAEGSALCRAQQLLLERATITTLHGFCSEFLRTHFEQADVDPAFRVLDDAENRRLTDEALDEAIEEAYADPDDDLSALDYGRGPKGVRAMAEALLSFLDERPDPEEWLASVCSGDAFVQKWLDEMIVSARSGIDQAILFSRLALQDEGCNENYAAPLEKDIQALTDMRQISEYAPLFRALKGFKQATAGRAKCGPAGDEMKKLRAEAKKAVDKIAMLNLPLQTALQDAGMLLPQLRLLGKIALRAREILESKKADISGLSYSDLEHRALKALQDDDTAASMRAAYDYIFVDEYQDTSDVQEALVGRIARKNNLFMVGDVKQSIYRFRQAEPRLFLEKYEKYGENDGGTLLPLTMNFRSQAKILDFVNRVFERAMHGDASEIVYDELARLNCGIGGDSGVAEIHLLSGAMDETMDEALAEYKTCEREALFIAGRIRQLMAENPELHYRDFAVLTRTKRGVLGKMAAVLLQAGIPAYADGSEGFYDSMEIMLALSMLKLTANRRSDIELIGVLRSPVVGLSNDQLALIRIANPLVPFVDAALAYAENDDETGRQLRAFFEMLEKWQLLALSTDLGILTRTILEESGFYDCAGALPGGQQRQANLNRLIANAAAFDQNVSGSLTRFLKHTEKLQARGESDDAHLLGENDDVVRLMTAHKSKGLEFPVVFGAMMDRKFSGAQRSSVLSAHRDLGLGCAYCDPNLQSRRKTLPQLAIAERKKREDQAEELRILYVLMTRAKERLELVGSPKKIAGALTRWQALESVPDAANSYLDVIMPAIGTENFLYRVYIHEDTSELAAPEAAAPDAQLRLQELLNLPPADEDDPLVQALLWKYPDTQAAAQPLKLSVTGLLRQLEGPQEGEKLIERPAFLSEDSSRLSSTERGTAYHRAMQCLELEKLRALSGKALENEIYLQLDKLTEASRITAQQRKTLRPRALAGFFQSAEGQRLLASDTVQREWSFNVMMRMSEALTNEEAGSYADGEILVQGSIDCCFMEGGKWILLDYKTDRSDDPEALTQRYYGQLRMYALALERVTGIPVGGIYLCLLQSGENIAVSLQDMGK